MKKKYLILFLFLLFATNLYAGKTMCFDDTRAAYYSSYYNRWEQKENCRTYILPKSVFPGGGPPDCQICIQCSSIKDGVVKENGPITCKKTNEGWSNFSGITGNLNGKMSLPTACRIKLQCN